MSSRRTKYRIAVFATWLLVTFFAFQYAFPSQGAEELVRLCKTGREEQAIEVMKGMTDSKISSIRDEKGWTLMHCAAYSASDQITSFLLHHGIDADAEDCNLTTSINVAFETLELVKHFQTAKGLRTNFAWRFGYENEMSDAEAQECVERAERTLRLLLCSSRDLKHLDAHSESYLYQAVSVGSLWSTKWLLTKGISPQNELGDSSTEPILYQAIKLQNTEIVELLLAHGAFVTGLGKKWESEIGEYAASNCGVEINSLLLEAGLDPHLQVPDSGSLLASSIRNEDVGVFDLYLRKSDEEQIRNALWETVRLNTLQHFAVVCTKVNNSYIRKKATELLWLACEAGSDRVISALLDYDADPNLRRESDGMTAFLLATGRCQLDVLRLLGSKVDNPAITSNRGENAIYLAAQALRCDEFAYLESLGISPCVLTQRGDSPLDVFVRHSVDNDEEICFDWIASTLKRCTATSERKKKIRKLSKDAKAMENPLLVEFLNSLIENDK